MDKNAFEQLRPEVVLIPPAVRDHAAYPIRHVWAQLSQPS